MPIRGPHKLLTTGQVAKALGVAPATVARWYDLGKLAGHTLPAGTTKKPRGERRFRRSDVIAFARQHGLPLALDGYDSPDPGGVLVACSQDAGVLGALARFGELIVHPATCAADVGFQAARLLPEMVLLDLVVLSRWEALEAAACLLRRIPTLRVVLVVNEDDPGQGYPAGAAVVGRPLDPAALASALVGRAQ